MFKQLVSLFLLKTGLVSGHIKNLLEEYVEGARVILSVWKDDRWKVWYKEMPYFENKLFNYLRFTDGNYWKVIQYHMDKTAKYMLKDSGYTVLFNRTGKIRALDDISAGNNFLILWKKGWDLPCICILRKNPGVDNNLEMYNRMLHFAMNSNAKELVRLINLYCHVYPMFTMAPISKGSKLEHMYTFGIQVYTEGVINDGLYIRESEVKGDDKGNFIIL